MSIAAKRRAYRLRLWDTQGGLCYYCGTRMSLNRTKNGSPARDFATFEHLKRREDGGGMGPENIVLAHRKCNTKRNIEHQAGVDNEQLAPDRNGPSGPPHTSIWNPSAAV